MYLIFVVRNKIKELNIYIRDIFGSQQSENGGGAILAETHRKLVRAINCILRSIEELGNSVLRAYVS